MDADQSNVGGLSMMQDAQPKTSTQNNSAALSVIDLTEAISLELCRQWLQQTHDAASDQAFRRLIRDVMGELEELETSVNPNETLHGELGSLVVGAVGSVQSILELQNR